jgi:N utilization substance protein B
MDNTTPRHQARELVLKSLYACELEENVPAEAFERIAATFELSDKNIEFARHVFTLVVEKAAEVDKDISRLAENWEIDRIAALDRIVLRMAMVELKNCPDVPVKVVLNEAIELAKTFSGPSSSGFVNGILDRFVKEMEEV